MANLPSRESSHHIAKEISTIESELQQLPKTLPSPTPWTRGYSSSWDLKTGEDVRIDIHFDETSLVDEIILVPQTYLNEENELTVYGFPLRFMIERQLPDGTTEVIIDHRDHDYEIFGYEPQCFPINNPAPTAGLVITVTELDIAPDWYWKDNTPVVTLREVLAFFGEKNIALNATVDTSSSYLNGYIWTNNALVDGFFAFAPIDRDLSEPREEYHVYADELILEFDLGEIRPVDEFRLWPVIEHDFPTASGTSFPIDIKLQAKDEEQATYSKTIYMSRNIHQRPGASPLIRRIKGQVEARYLRFTFKNSLHDFRFERPHKITLSEVQILNQGKVISAGLIPEATSSQHLRVSQSENLETLTDGRTNEGTIIPLRQWINQMQLRAQLERQLKKLHLNLKIAQHQEQQRARFLVAAAVATIVILILLIYVVKLLGERRLIRMRMEIAGDLHDEVGANLSSIAHTTELVGETISQPTETQNRLLTYASETSRKSARDIRQIVEFLERRHHMDSVTEEMGKVAKEILVGIQLSYIIKDEAVFDKMGPVNKWNLILFVKEASNNILKHANATEVTMTAMRSGSHGCLIIEDNGQGIPSQAVPQHLDSRAKRLGGTLNIETFAGQGTCITLTL